MEETQPFPKYRWTFYTDEFADEVGVTLLVYPYEDKEFFGKPISTHFVSADTLERLKGWIPEAIKRRHEHEIFDLNRQRNKLSTELGKVEDRLKELNGDQS